MMNLEWTYTRLAVPDLWDQLVSAGAAPVGAYARLVSDHDIAGPTVELEDYERFIEDVHAVNYPSR